MSPVPRYIDATIISNSDNLIISYYNFHPYFQSFSDVCSQTFGNLITSGNLCLSGENGKSTCAGKINIFYFFRLLLFINILGDSGGGLTILNNSQRILAGVVSFGNENCQRGYPTAFTRVTSFHDWIQRNTGITIN